MRWFLSIAIAIAIPTHVFSQEPSYAETVRFLEEKINSSRRYDHGNCTGCGFGSDSQFSEVKHCRFSYTFIAKQHGYHDDLQRQIFNAGDIDPSRISTQNTDYVISTVTRNRELVEIWERRGVPTGQTLSNLRRARNVNSVGFYQILSPVEDNNRRVISAMQHLVRLCGGKEELF